MITGLFIDVDQHFKDYGLEETVTYGKERKAVRNNDNFVVGLAVKVFISR